MSLGPNEKGREKVDSKEEPKQDREEIYAESAEQRLKLAQAAGAPKPPEKPKAPPPVPSLYQFTSIENIYAPPDPEFENYLDAINIQNQILRTRLKRYTESPSGLVYTTREESFYITSEGKWNTGLIKPETDHFFIYVKTNAGTDEYLKVFKTALPAEVDKQIDALRKKQAKTEPAPEKAPASTKSGAPAPAEASKLKAPLPIPPEPKYASDIEGIYAPPDPEFENYLDAINIQNQILRTRLKPDASTPSGLVYAKGDEAFAVLGTDDIYATENYVTRADHFFLAVTVQAHHNPQFDETTMADVSIFRTLKVKKNDNPSAINKEIDSLRTKESKALLELGKTAKTLKGKMDTILSSIAVGPGESFLYATEYEIILLPNNRIKIKISDEISTPEINLNDPKQAINAFISEQVRAAEKKEHERLAKEAKKEILKYDWKGLFAFDAGRGKDPEGIMCELIHLNYVNRRINPPAVVIGVPLDGVSGISRWFPPLQEEDYIPHIRSDIFTTPEDALQDFRSYLPTYERLKQLALKQAQAKGLPAGMAVDENLNINFNTEKIAQIKIDPLYPYKDFIVVDASGKRLKITDDAYDVYLIIQALYEKIIMPRLMTSITKAAKGAKLTLKKISINSYSVERDNAEIGKIYIMAYPSCNLEVRIWKPRYDLGPALYENRDKFINWRFEGHKYETDEALTNYLIDVFPTTEQAVQKRIDAIGPTIGKFTVINEGASGDYQILRVYMDKPENTVCNIALWRGNPEWMDLTKPGSGGWISAGTFTDVAKLKQEILKLPAGFLETEQIIIPIGTLPPPAGAPPASPFDPPPDP